MREQVEKKTTKEMGKQSKKQHADLTQCKCTREHNKERNKKETQTNLTSNKDDNGGQEVKGAENRETGRVGS